MKWSKKLERYTNYFIILLVIILIVNSIVIIFLNKTFSAKINEINELNKPANLKIISIVNSNCKDCFSTSDALTEIKAQNANITEEKTLEFNSEEARTLINKYNINKIPT